MRGGGRHHEADHQQSSGHSHAASALGPVGFRHGPPVQIDAVHASPGFESDGGPRGSGAAAQIDDAGRRSVGAAHGTEDLARDDKVPGTVEEREGRLRFADLDFRMIAPYCGAPVG